MRPAPGHRSPGRRGDGEIDGLLHPARGKDAGLRFRPGRAGKRGARPRRHLQRRRGGEGPGKPRHRGRDSGGGRAALARQLCPEPGRRQRRSGPSLHRIHAGARGGGRDGERAEVWIAQRRRDPVGGCGPPGGPIALSRSGHAGPVPIHLLRAREPGVRVRGDQAALREHPPAGDPSGAGGELAAGGAERREGPEAPASDPGAVGGTSGRQAVP